MLWMLSVVVYALVYCMLAVDYSGTTAVFAMIL